MGGFLIALAVGIVLFATAVYVVRLLATPLPPEPDPEAVLEISSDYRCSVCGLRLTVTHAQGAEHAAPRHCREEMVAV